MDFVIALDAPPLKNAKSEKMNKLLSRFFSSLALRAPLAQQPLNMTRLLIGGAILAAILPAYSQTSETLIKIRETRILSLGYRETSIPFSFLDDRQRPVGYTIDICKRVAEALRVKLGIPTLEIRMVPVTAATRFALVANGIIDMECGSTSNTLERQKSVAFLLTTYVATTRFLSKKNDPVNSADDLRGRSVVSSAGTTSMSLLSELNTKSDLQMKVAVAADHFDAFEQIKSGRASAFLMDDILLYGLIATSDEVSAYMLSELALSTEPYAIVVRKNDPEFKKAVDLEIREIFRSGAIFAIYKRWFETTLPPKGVNLQFPMTAAFKKLVANPIDSANPADYR